MAKSCTNCGFELVRGNCAVVEGTELGWRVRLLDYPVLVCPQGHERREPFPDFNTYWASFLAHEAPDLWLKPRGIFRRELPCGRCDRPVRPLTPVTIERTIDLAKHPGYAFMVTMSGRGFHCERCEHLWLDDGDSADIFEALAHALKSAGIRRF